MKIGFISDVHANLPALEAVLRDMSARNVGQIYCSGDILGYYTYPDEVVELLRERNVHCIAGNHDRAVLVGTKGMNSIAAAAIEWTREHISSSTFEFIRDLPNSIHRPVEDVMTALHHGSPRHMSEYIFEEHVSDELLSLAGAKLLVLGHTHMPYRVQFPIGNVINPGSVGQPRDGDPRASYAILDSSEWSFSTIRVAYDQRPVMRGVRENQLPEMLASRLLRGI
ncbi:MAG: metallophosphoesterase family protein [Euryarchaeota archaeon]|nr:metallophosphoesterase family protein [Euryarchaeota archaeon]